MKRTSFSDPLRIREFSFGKGTLGVTMCPGKKISSHGVSSGWNRDLDDDLDSVAFWGAKLVLTLVVDDELKSFKLLKDSELSLLGSEVLARGMTWSHVGIDKGGIPDDLSLSSLFHIASEVHALVESGTKILIHCDDGFDRSGLIAALFLVCWSSRPAKAIERVRSVCGPDALREKAQEELVFLAAQKLGQSFD